MDISANHFKYIKEQPKADPFPLYSFYGSPAQSNLMTELKASKSDECIVKIKEFADDTIGTLHNESELSYFREHINTFCAATNMLENA
eukprot:6192794-Pleurochrysis_carterae.AAC.1